MSIYSVNKSINENVVLDEGFELFSKASFDVPKDLYDIADDTIDKFEKMLGSRRMYKNILRPNPGLFKDHKSFNKIIQKNKDIVKKSRSKNVAKIPFKFNIVQLEPSARNIGALEDAVNSLIVGLGFKRLKRNGNAFQKLFSGDRLIKYIGEDFVIFCEWSISWTEYNGTIAGLNDIQCSFKCVEFDEKVKKKLEKFSEAYGIFESVEFLNGR